MSYVSLNNIVKRFSGSSTPAVDKLSLDVGQGEFLCLLGPSGCGKTTTLRMLAGLEQPTAGTISIANRVTDDVSNGIFVPPERRNLGLVFQSYALWPHLTVRENILQGWRFTAKRRGIKVNREVIYSRVEGMMDKLSIRDYGARYPSELSGGQQQRVALARTLIAEPELILMDEPLSNLDAKLRLEMRSELKRIHREFNTTIIFVTHDQWEAMTLATSIAVMDKGRLQQLGSPDNIYREPQNQFIAEFVGTPTINLIELAESDNRLTRELRRLTMRVMGDETWSCGSVGIRPETIVVGDSSDDQKDDDHVSVRAVSHGVLPTGGSWILQFDIDDVRLTATTSTQPTIREGDSVQLFVPMRDLLLFDAEKRRIESVLST